MSSKIEFPGMAFELFVGVKILGKLNKARKLGLLVIFGQQRVVVDYFNKVLNNLGN